MKSNINSLEQDVQLKEQTKSEISKEIVMRHLNSFLDNNLDILLSDYTNESVLITQAATYSGPEEIGSFFVDFNTQFPKPATNLILDKIEANDDMVYIVWHAKTPSLQVPIGSDTFIIKDGKIFQQTFVGQLNFINEP